MRHPSIPPRELDDCTAHDLLTDEELKALGLVAAEWGLLEASLERHGNLLFRLLGVNLAYMTGGAGGRRYAEILASALPTYFPDEKEAVANARSELLKVGPLAAERSDLIHAAWTDILTIVGFGPPRPKEDRGDKAWGFLRKSRGAKHKSFTYTAAQMADVAARIAATRNSINRAMYDLLPSY